MPARFYRSASGTEPVRDWLKELSTADRRAIGFDIATDEFGWPVGMPLCRSLGEGSWEIRSNLSSCRVARVLFCMSRGRMILLHGIVKKSQKTPATELVLARRRQKKVQR